MLIRPQLSIIVIFHDMQREAYRTLFSLSSSYQLKANDLNYEVIAIDSNSKKPLSANLISSMGNNYKYYNYKTESISPVDAINYGVDQAKSKNIMIIIDGARILSPGILNYTNNIFKFCKNPFIYTLGLHLGPKIQNHSILEGYNQHEEDQLLNNINWKTNGYKLHKISSLAGSSSNGYFGNLSESNCFILPKSIYKDLGGMNPAFQSAGGGLVNLDFFRKVHSSGKCKPFMLLGEGTFHQIHGGVATNVPPKDHPMEIFQKEYKRIYGTEWEDKDYPVPTYYGKISIDAIKFI